MDELLGVSSSTMLKLYAEIYRRRAVLTMLHKRPVLRQFAYRATRSFSRRPKCRIIVLHNVC